MKQDWVTRQWEEKRRLAKKTISGGAVNFRQVKKEEGLWTVTGKEWKALLAVFLFLSCGPQEGHVGSLGLACVGAYPPSSWKKHALCMCLVCTNKITNLAGQIIRFVFLKKNNPGTWIKNHFVVVVSVGLIPGRPEFKFWISLEAFYRWPWFIES